MKIILSDFTFDVEGHPDFGRWSKLFSMDYPIGATFFMYKDKAYATGTCAIYSTTLDKNYTWYQYMEDLINGKIKDDPYMPTEFELDDG